MKFKTVGAGKGSVYRPVDKKRYDESYENIFGKKDEKPSKSNPYKSLQGKIL